MARKLVVEVVGDATSLNRAFAQSTRSAQKFDRQMGAIGRGATAGAGVFRGLGRSIAFASGAFLGGFGLATAIRSATDELLEQQRTAAQTAAVIKSTGGIAGVTAEHVNDLAQSLLNLTGIDDEVIQSGANMLLTFTNVRNVAGKNNDIFDQAAKVGLDMAAALQGAGFEGGNLQTTMIRLGKALNDPVRGITALRRVGVQFTKEQEKQIKALVETGRTMDAQKMILRELNREFGGSAAAAGDTLGGKLDKLRESLRNVSASILEQFAPALERTLDRLVAWVQNTDNQRRVLDQSRQVIGTVSDVLKTLGAAFGQLNKVTGSTRRTLELLLGTFLAFKALQLAGGIAAFGTALTGAAAGATTFNAALRGNAGLIALTGAAAFALTTMALNATGLDKKLRDLGGSLFDVAQKMGLVGKAEQRFEGKLIPSAADIRLFRREMALALQAGKSQREAIDMVVRLHPEVDRHDVEVAAGILAKVQAPAGALGPITARDVDRRRQRLGAEPPGAIDPAISKRLKTARDAARQAVIDQAELTVARTALTEKVSDDIAALQKLNALLKRRIAGGHGTLELQRQQIQVEIQIADLVRQQAETRKRAALDARNARQFRLLGFGPTGEDLVPGVNNLKRQLASVRDVIAGSFLDTRKTRGLLAHIRQILAGGLGSVSSEVRARIQQILADLKAQLKQSSVDVTRFHDSARGQFTLAGATPGGALVINGDVNVHGVTDVKGFENEMAKRKKQRAHARRSTR